MHRYPKYYPITLCWPLACVKIEIRVVAGNQDSELKCW